MSWAQRSVARRSSWGISLKRAMRARESSPSFVSWVAVVVMLRLRKVSVRATSARPASRRTSLTATLNSAAGSDAK